MAGGRCSSAAFRDLVRRGVSPPTKSGTYIQHLVSTPLFSPHSFFPHVDNRQIVSSGSATFFDSDTMISKRGFGFGKAKGSGCFVTWHRGGMRLWGGVVTHPPSVGAAEIGYVHFSTDFVSLVGAGAAPAPTIKLLVVVICVHAVPREVITQHYFVSCSLPKKSSKSSPPHGVHGLSFLGFGYFAPGLQDEWTCRFCCLFPPSL